MKLSLSPAPLAARSLLLMLFSRKVSHGLFLVHDFMGVKALLNSDNGENQEQITITSSALSPIKRQDQLCSKHIHKC